MKSKFALLALLLGGMFVVTACGGANNTSSDACAGSGNQCASPEAGNNADVDNTNKDSSTTTVAKYDIGVEGMT